MCRSSWNGATGAAPALRATDEGGLRIIHISPNALLPTDRGGRIREHHLWRAFANYGEVTPVIVGDRPGPAIRSRLRRAGVVFFPRRLYRQRTLEEHLDAGKPATGRLRPGLFELNSQAPLRSDLLDLIDPRDALNFHHLNDARIERIVGGVAALEPDMIYVGDTTLGALIPALSRIGAKIVFGPQNMDSELYRSMSHTAPREDLRRYYGLMADAFHAVERQSLDLADQIWVCSHQDAERFRAIAPRSRIFVVPNVYDDDGPVEPSTSRNLVYVGAQTYFPNAVAARHLIGVSQRLDEMKVKHTMQIVGRSVPSVVEAARAAPNVVVTGDVPDVMTYLADAAVVPVALTLGGGTRLKVLEAMSIARPIVSTPIGIEGIDAVDGESAVIEPDLERFPQRIAELLEQPDRARRMGLAGYELLQRSYSHEALLKDVETAMRALFPRRRRVDADEAFAANIGLERRNDVATYDPATRLLVWSLQARMAAMPANLHVALVGPDDQSFPNGFASVGREAGSWITINAEAVLPPTLDWSDVRVVVWAWGRDIAHLSLLERPAAKEGAVVAAEPREEGFDIVAWYGSRPATVSVRNGDPIELPTRDNGAIHVGRAILAAPPGASEIVIEPSEGAAETVVLPPTWRRREPPTSFRLEQWKDRYKGETAWLVGNGPSVRLPDLEKLDGKLTFCFNRFYLAYPTISFRPTFTVSADRQMIDDFGQEMVDLAGGTVFLCDDDLPAALGDYVWVRLAATRLFSLDPTRVANPGGSSLFVAMQIAYYMGIRKLYVYGADFKFAFNVTRNLRDKFRTASGDGNHFIQNYRSGKAWCPPSLKDIAPSFQMARYLFSAEGGFIRNATRGGILEIFERAPFDKAVRDTPRVQARHG